jgi:gamma-glutamylcyclotransferase (GGCT)/AIG2-like uncharacterized protein YtfP
MDLFVYGTLTEPARVATLVDAHVFVGAARVEGLHPVEGRYPTLAPGGTVAGRVLRVDDTAVPAIDEYEGVADGLYVRTTVPYDGPDAASVDLYVGDPDRLDAPVTWPGEGSLADRVDRVVDTHDVRAYPVDGDR